MSTRQVAEADSATGLNENASAAHVGGGIAWRARKELESKTGQPVVSGESFLPPAPPIQALKSK